MKDNFKKYYKFPLNGFYSKVFTADNHIAFDFAIQLLYPDAMVTSNTQRASIIGAINDGIQLSSEYKVSFKDGVICFDDKPIIIIRGWGYLTGGGTHALNLEPEVAAKIQDEFGEYIVDIFSGK